MHDFPCPALSLQTKADHTFLSLSLTGTDPPSRFFRKEKNESAACDHWGGEEAQSVSVGTASRRLKMYSKQDECAGTSSVTHVAHRAARKHTSAFCRRQSLFPPAPLSCNLWGGGGGRFEPCVRPCSYDQDKQDFFHPASATQQPSRMPSSTLGRVYLETRCDLFAVEGERRKERRNGTPPAALLACLLD